MNEIPNIGLKIIISDHEDEVFMRREDTHASRASGVRYSLCNHRIRFMVSYSILYHIIHTKLFFRKWRTRYSRCNLANIASLPLILSTNVSGTESVHKHIDNWRANHGYVFHVRQLFQNHDYDLERLLAVLGSFLQKFIHALKHTRLIHDIISHEKFKR